MLMNTPLLEFIGVEKAFFGVKVLKGVSFTVPAGGAAGLVGENGAGKSTLMNILGGNLPHDAGSMRFDGEDYAPSNPQDAARRGIAFIHQELNLFPNLTLAENIFLTRFPRVRATPFIQRGEMHRRAADLLREVGLQVPPHWLVETLSAGERQLLEIAKALSIEARLIIFDEPTTSLSERETQRLFALIARLRTRGLAMIYISHTLADVFRLCDDIVVLRDGEVAGCGAKATFTNEKLVSLMVGRAISQLYPERRKKSGAGGPPVPVGGSPAGIGRAPTDAIKSPLDSNVSPLPSGGWPDGTGQWPVLPVLEARGIFQPNLIEDVSFKLHSGEVLGLAGLMGAGRSELVRILFGLDPCARGEVRRGGELLHHLAPRSLIERGMAFLTENRHREGLCLDATVADNLTLVTLPQHGRSPLRWLSRDSLQAAVTRIRAVVGLDPKASDTQPVRTLSGGNQQKAVLGKWLLREPRVLILDEPTRGIDVGAKFEIYRLIHELADKGTGVLVISSEMEELMGLCDRILVLRSGALVDEMPRTEFNRERILRAALGREATSERIV
jgi:ribose transport system ATP-binding protein